MYEWIAAPPPTRTHAAQEKNANNFCIYGVCSLALEMLRIILLISFYKSQLHRLYVFTYTYVHICSISLGVLQCGKELIDTP